MTADPDVEPLTSLAISMFPGDEPGQVRVAIGGFGPEPITQAEMIWLLDEARRLVSEYPEMVLTSYGKDLEDLDLNLKKKT